MIRFRPPAISQIVAGLPVVGSVVSGGARQTLLVVEVVAPPHATVDVETLDAGVEVEVAADHGGDDEVDVLETGTVEVDAGTVVTFGTVVVT
jgi:hypothetical protein